MQRQIMGLLVVVGFLMASEVGAEINTLLSYQGRLLSTNGQPVNGNVTIAVAIYTNVSEGSQVYAESVGTVPVQDGVYSFQFGTNSAELKQALMNEQCWLEVSVNGGTLSPRQRMTAVPYALTAYGLSSGLLDSLNRLSSLAEPGAWSVYDAGNTGGMSTKGYHGAVFDGRYVYFVPYYDGSAYHGRVLRYDTQGEFIGQASWVVYNAEYTGGLTNRGYSGGVYDGRYVYFVPASSFSNDTHGKVLRYDTRGEFTSAASWASYNAENTYGLTIKGYHGGVYDGRYVYFVPYHDGSVYHGRVLRYDTHGVFTNQAYWAVYNAELTGGAVPDKKGYVGGVFDGRYVYFVPHSDGSAFHGRVLRYDTQGGFTDSQSWSAYDAGNTGGLSTKGYDGGIYDGRYVYFVPYYDGYAPHGRVLRYDTQGGFTDSQNWSAYDAGNTGGLTTKGYVGGIYDGRYVYFVPHNEGSAYHGRVLRYDPQGVFTNRTSWMVYDAGNVMGLSTKGYFGGIYDGRYVYFLPSYDGSAYHGRVLRFEARTLKPYIPPTMYGGSFF